MEVRDQLLRVCALLNEHGARYLIVGGHACILHGHVRTTEDVDILVEDSIENFQRVIAGLSALEDHAAAELTPQDIAENVVVKIADEVEVDVSRQAWQVHYAEVRTPSPPPRRSRSKACGCPSSASKCSSKARPPTESRIARIWCGCATCWN